MHLKTLWMTLYLCLNIVFVFSSLQQYENPRKVRFLTTLKLNVKPLDVVYVFDDESEDWSGCIYRVFQPVYTVSLPNKGKLFREYSIMRDIDTVLDNNNLYIVSLHNFSVFVEVVDNIRHLVFFKARHKLVFIIKNDTVTPENIAQAFKYCFKHWMINTAIIFTDDLDLAYTYNPFQNNYFIPRSISKIFYDKTMNLHGFRLNVSMFSDNLNAKEVNGTYEGLDGMMSTTIMGAINATCNYVVPSDGAVFGCFNHTYVDGALADIISKRTQIGFNARFSIHTLYKVVELTYSHCRNDLVVLVPIEKPPTLKNIFAMTSNLTWVLVFTLAILLYLYIHKFNKHLDFGAVMTVIVLVLTGRPIHEVTFTKFRIFFMSSMLLMFYLTADFNCRLTSVLTISIVPSGPSTLDELWQTVHYKIKSRPSFTSFLGLYVSPKLGHKLKKNAEGIERDAQVREIMKCQKEIILCKRDIALAAIRRSLIINRTPCFKIMKEIFMPSLQAYVVPYGSPFIKRFDGIIHRLHASGIFLFWEKGTFGPRNGRCNKEPYKLSVESLYVAFVVLGVGLLTSMLVFLFEYKSI